MKWIIRGLYNRTVFPKTLAPNAHEATADALRVYGTTGYTPGDLVEESWIETIDPETIIGTAEHSVSSECEGCLLSVCDFFYMKYNRDDRPDGKTERSLSMGDLIQIAVSESEIHTFAVRSLGWEEISYGGQSC